MVRLLSPAETTRALVEGARRVERQPFLAIAVLSLLAGAYISFGSHLATVVTQDPLLGRGFARFLGGSVFSVGLVFVVICGAELVTGNFLLAAAALDGAVRPAAILRHWGLVFAGNLAGALAFVALVAASGQWDEPGFGAHVAGIARAKLALGFGEAFARAVLCNWLVCLAVFMATAAQDTVGKVLACYLPIMAFVASGFEHAVADMFLVPAGLLADGAPPAGAWVAFVTRNLVPVTLGNAVGGGLFVGVAYWLVHLRGGRASGQPLP